MQSYSQNLEDVLLNRCFKNQNSGIYVDVGAGPGDGFSVTKNLYLQGWSGLLIEPVPAYAEFHRNARPRDTVVPVAVGAEDCDIEFVHFFNTGLSTKKLFVNDSFKDLHSYELLIVPQMKLSSILSDNGVSHIDLLKIDVEGSEMEVLLGLDFEKFQPRLIVIEATRPMSSIRISDALRKYLISVGYRLALFDGLNDYFVFMGEQQMMAALDSPVNIFDGDYFKNTVNSDHHNRIHELEMKNLILDQQFIQACADKEKVEIALIEQSKILQWYQAHLYVLDNSIRMKIGTFIVKLLVPFKPTGLKLMEILSFFKKPKFFEIKKHVNGVARILLRGRVIRVITTYIRVARCRRLGFWGWTNYRVNLKNFLRIFKLLFKKKQQPFDAEKAQTRAGMSRLGLGDIETHAFETLLRDLDDFDVVPFSVGTNISRIIMDIRCIQAPGLAARGIGKHASFIINEVRLWAEELNLEISFLASAEIETPEFLNSTELISVLPENTNNTLFFQLSSMTENPIPSLPILLNPNSYKIGVFYDFIPKHNPGYYLWGRSAKALYSANLSTLKLYDEFWAISNSVSDELRSHLKKFGRHQTPVIPTGVSAKIPVTSHIPMQLNRTDILIPTGGDARKDPLTALASLVLLSKDESIKNVLIIGHLPHKAIRELQNIVKGTWISPKLKFLAPTSFDHIASAYSKARLTLVSSLDEGYSLPIVESISMKVPVLASNIPAHRELLQTKYLFRPKSLFGAARKIRLSLKTINFTESSDYLNSAGLLVAEKVIPTRLSVLKSDLRILANTPFNNYVDSRKSISVITPWPPLRTGIGDYSESTLKDPLFEIVCSDAYDTRRLDLRTWNWCEIAKSRRLFVLGNNHNFHSSAMYALMKMGGNALVHDTRILDMWSNLFGAHLYDYINKFKSISRDDFDSSFMNLDSATTLGFEPLIPAVHRFITHSALLKEHLNSIGAKNVDCIPFASRIPNISTEKTHRNSQNEFVIGVFGITDIKTKHFDLIYDACADLVANFPSLQLICVGELLNDAAHFLDQNDRRAATWLQLKGRVGELEYWELLAKCHMTIHVRKIKRLSLSGAVMDSLAMGVPIVCSESILSEMQIPRGLPFSEPLSDAPDLMEVKKVITRMIQSRTELQRDELFTFAKNRDNFNYLRKLKTILG